MQHTLPHGPSLLTTTREAGIVSSSPILSQALQQSLEDRIDRFACRPLDAVTLSGRARASEPHLLVLAPQNWQEMADWLPRLGRQFPRSPWMVFGDLRIGGMFLSVLDTRPCILVPPGASPAQLGAALQALVERRASGPAVELLLRFGRIVPIPSGIGPPRRPSAMELQCACAASFGLANRQIAATFHVQEATVKSHLHRVMRKLDLSDRYQLGDVVREAFSASCAPMEWV
jgi:DNA-binding NarL/FixJ family response regulator